MNKMSLEQADHFMRHIERHANAFRKGEFEKDISYIKKLKEAQEIFLEISHDMIHVMRQKQFKGYEEADFDFYVYLPLNYKEHIFRKFDYGSFSIGIRLKETIDMGFIEERSIPLKCEDAQLQLEILGNAIQDAEVFIKILSEYFQID